MSGCSGADSAQAVEQNYLYVLDLCATMAGAPSLPLHGSFKAIGRVLHLKISYIAVMLGFPIMF